MVTELKIVKLLVTACYIIINDRTINWFDDKFALFFLYGQNLLSFLQYRHALLKVSQLIT